jgi:hypothetical protein
LVQASGSAVDLDHQGRGMKPLKLVDHGENPDFWHHEPPIYSECWVCGKPTMWIYLDIGHQHPDCDWYPTEDGEVKIIGGKQVDI